MMELLRLCLMVVRQPHFKLMKRVILFLLIPILLYAKPVHMTSITHWPYIRFLHDAVYLEMPIEIRQNEDTNVSLVRIYSSESSGQVRPIGGWINDPKTGKMFDSGIPKSYEIDYSGEIISLDEFSGDLPSGLKRIKYNWKLQPSENDENSVERAKDRAYNVWSSGGYALLQYNPKLDARSGVVTHSTIPADWVSWVRPGLEGVQALVDANYYNLQEAALSKNPILAKYALGELVRRGELDTTLFSKAIAGRSDFDEVVLVSALISEIDNSESSFDELKSAIVQLVRNNSSFERTLLYAMSKYINFPVSSPKLRLYTPTGSLLKEVSATAETRVKDYFTGKNFSNFVSSMSTLLFEVQETEANASPRNTPTEIAEEVSIVELEVKEPTEVTPVETPAPSPQWWLWLVGLLVVVGLGFALRRKS